MAFGKGSNHAKERIHQAPQLRGLLRGLKSPPDDGRRVETDENGAFTVTFTPLKELRHLFRAQNKGLLLKICCETAPKSIYLAVQ